MPSRQGWASVNSGTERSNRLNEPWWWRPNVDSIGGHLAGPAPTSLSKSGLGRMDKCGAEHEGSTTVLGDLAFQRQTDVHGYSLRRRVLRPDDRDKVLDTRRSGRLANLRGCLGREALSAQREMHVLADFDVRLTLDVLDGQPTVTDELSVVSLDHPQAVPVVGVVALVPLDPLLGLRPRP